LVEAPCDYVNVAWFEDSRTLYNSKCVKCPSKDIRCNWCLGRFEGEVFLLLDFDQQSTLNCLKSIPVKDLHQALKMKEIESIYEVLTPKRLYYLQNKYKCHFYFYEKIEDVIQAVYEPGKVKFLQVIKFLLRENFPSTENGVIENFEIINHASLLPRYYVCDKTFGCKYGTFVKRDFTGHNRTCGIFNVQKNNNKQQSYGDDKSKIKEMVALNLIPKEALAYRDFTLATWDIETIEQKITLCNKKRGMETEAHLQLLSLAVGSNIPGQTAKCWVRKSLDSGEEKRIVKYFVKEISKLQKAKLELLPDWIQLGIDKIEDIIYELKTRKTSYVILWKWNSFKNELQKMIKLDVFGFNSAKFDIPCIASSLFSELKLEFGAVTILKKMTSYISIDTKKCTFKDALKFTAPCSYDKFTRVWDAPTVKGIWPYSLYSDIMEMKAAKKFPPLSDFANTLKGGIRPSMSSYIAGKTEFHRRKLLPVGDPDRISSMLGYLRYYNIQDVLPLAKAIENCFKCYSIYFDINPMSALSLPSLAQEAMFKNFDPTSPLIYSFTNKFKYLSDVFRSSTYGGLVNVYRTHVTTFDQPPHVPKTARYAANGDPFTFIIALDVNAMYLGCQGKEMPTSPGILHSKKNDTYNKKIMCEGHSFKCQQWLCERQARGLLINK
jgi:hypothetical protein